MLPSINLGPLVFPTGALVVIIGAWLCLSLLERSAQSLGLAPEVIYNLGGTAVIAGFIGARLGFIALHWSAYQENLLGIVWPLNTGYTLGAGLAAAAVAAFFYGRFYNLPPLPTLDALAPALVIALIVASLADFLGGPGYGETTFAPWGISQYGIRRHPVQMYEIIVGLLALASWWRLHIRRSYAGQLFLVTTAVYAAGRLVVDAFRANAWLVFGGYHAVQIISLAVLLACLLALGYGRGSRE